MAEYIPVPSDYLREPDFSIEMDSKTWASVYLGETDVSEEIKSSNIKLTKGDEAELASIFDMFDKFEQTKNYKVPPIED